MENPEVARCKLKSPPGARANDRIRHAGCALDMLAADL